jgi:uncharacterized membrane protein
MQFDISLLSSHFKIASKRQEPFISMCLPRIALWSCILSYFCFFSLLGVWRHWGYITSPYDLGAFDQAIWTASQRGSMLNSFNGSGQTMNWLGIHFQPILYLFVPLYKLYPSVHWLTVSQSAAFSFSALPIFAIARHATRSEKNAVIWALIYLLNPFVIAAATWDFHEVSLATFFISLGLYAITQKRLLLLMVSSLFLLACKEHFGLTVAGLGILYGVVHKNWLVGAGFSAIGIMAMALIIGVIMPSYSPTGQHLMIKPAISMHSSSLRYAWLGNSAASVIENLLMHPFITIEAVFVTMNGWRYLGALFVPFLFLPAGSPIWITPIVSDLLANLLSAIGMPRLITSYHSAPIIPILTVASINGLRRFSPFLTKFSANSFLKSILLLNVLLAYCFAPLPFSGSLNYWQPVKTIVSFDARERIIKKIVENSSVSIQANLIAHFTQTNSFYFFPQKTGDADFIVLRLDSPTTKLTTSTSREFGTLAQLLQMDPAFYLDSIEELIDNPHYQLVYWSDPWLIFGKEQKNVSSAVLRQVRLKIQSLRQKWSLPNR